MPVLGNPLNQIGWSDLVSKDLMDKFHNFMAHTYVTLGQVKGRTLLPLPPSDVTSSEKTSSKDKAHILEGKSNVQKGRLMSFIWWNYSNMKEVS
jgi:dynein heavy chain